MTIKSITITSEVIETTADERLWLELVDDVRELVQVDGAAKYSDIRLKVERDNVRRLRQRMTYYPGAIPDEPQP